MKEIEIENLKTSISVAWRARENGNHPFGAVLVDENGRIMLQAENTLVTGRDITGHAETNLVRLATQHFTQEQLAGCTLYSSTEPCAMCSGAIYWGGVGRVVYALSEVELYEMTGRDGRNQTLTLPCREVFGRGQREVQVEGPFDLPEAAEVHRGFWGS